MENLDYISFSANNNHYAKAKRGKARENSKKEKKRTDKLSEIERDYMANLSSAEEDFACLGEIELLESLDKLNFNFDELEQADEKQDITKKFRKNKSKIIESESTDKVDYYPVDSFSQFNRDIKLFLKSDDEKFETSPAPPDIRRFIHLLGNLYRLKTFSVGKNVEKRIVLQKTELSGPANNTRQVDKIVEQGNKAIKYSNGEEDHKSRDKSNRKSKKKSNNGNDSAKPADGALVGEKSAPIKDDNVGNKMLQKMGWTPGTGLGRDSSGITSHIPAVVKTKRTGLI